MMSDYSVSSDQAKQGHADQAKQGHHVALDVSAEEIQQHTVHVDMQCAVNNMSKGQDYACSGEAVCETTGLPFKWAAVFDGHGGHEVINYIRSENINKHAARPNPAESLQAAITESNVLPPYLPTSGSTMAMVKVFSDHADVITVGDSVIVVYEDGIPILVTQCHDSDNAGEVERVRTTFPYVRIESSHTIRVLSETRITSRAKSQFLYGGGLILAPSQALGHRNRTGICPGKYTVVFQPGKRYRITGASDGVFDMAILDHPSDQAILSRGLAEEVVAFYTSRWLQIWEYMKTPDAETVEQRFQYTEKQSDDVSAFTVDIV